MRRLKKKGLDKLKISQEPCEAEEQKFENLEKLFSKVLENFEQKKSDLQTLKSSEKAALYQMKQSGKL